MIEHLDENLSEIQGYAASFGSGSMHDGRWLKLVEKVNEIIDHLNQEPEPVALEEEAPDSRSIIELLERLKELGAVKAWQMHSSRPVAPLYDARSPDPVAYQTGDVVATYEVIFPGAGVRSANRVVPVKAGR